MCLKEVLQSTLIQDQESTFAPKDLFTSPDQEITQKKMGLSQPHVYCSYPMKKKEYGITNTSRGRSDVKDHSASGQGVDTDTDKASLTAPFAPIHKNPFEGNSLRQVSGRAVAQQPRSIVGIRKEIEMARLTKFQQARLNEFVSIHRLTHTALADPSTPTEVHYFLTGLTQERLKELDKKDLKPVVDAFCKMDLATPSLKQ